MAYLTTAQKEFFKENGYLIVRDLIDRPLIDAAVDLAWENMEEDRNDPTTWVDRGYRVVPNVGSSETAKRIVNETPVFTIAEEMAGKDALVRGGGAAAHFGFPRSDKNWQPPGGHLDGYHTPTNGVPKGTVGRFTIAATMYLNHVRPKAGGFTVWPGSHRVFARYFLTHPLDGPQGGQVSFPVGEPVEFTGGPGDVCFWHYWTYHSASANCGDEIRMALITRLRRHDANEAKFLYDGNLWRDWDGLR